MTICGDSLRGPFIAATVLIIKATAKVQSIQTRVTGVSLLLWLLRTR